LKLYLNILTETPYLEVWNTTDDWDETNMSYNNYIAPDTLQFNETISLGINESKTFDITNAFISRSEQANKNLSLYFKQQKNLTVYNTQTDWYGLSETNLRPALIIEYHVVANYTALTGMAISYSRCINDSYIEKTWFANINGNYTNISMANYCDAGCDNITNICNPLPFQQNLTIFIIIVSLIILFIILWSRRKWHHSEHLWYWLFWFYYSF